MEVAEISLVDFIEWLDRELYEASFTQTVCYDFIPAYARKDFQSFMVGKTLVEVDGRSFVHFKDFKAWAGKIMYGTGFDYPIKWIA